MAPILKETIYKWANVLKSKNFTTLDTFSIGSTTHLTNLLNCILHVKQQPKQLPLSWFQGFHFLYNNQQNMKLGSDGYDNYQAPTNEQGEQLYLRRLWARGEIDFIKAPEINAPITCVESLKSVRIIEDSVLVSILRDFSSNGGELLTESRTLTYTNELYTPPSENVKTIENPTEGPTFHISSVDLLKYSMLTYNLHKIHIDANYCRSIENLPNVIVHGPLQVTLLLYHFALNHPNVTPTKFKYRTYAPIFINDEVTISITQSSTANSYTLALYDKNTDNLYIQGELTVIPKNGAVVDNL